MKRVVPVFIGWMMLMSAGKIHAQFVDSIMDSHANLFPKEKMHIHFDKQLYNLNEYLL